MDELDRREFHLRAGAGAAARSVAGNLGAAQAFGEASTSQQVGNKALRQLKGAVSGRVFVRGKKGYGKARKVFNTRFNNKHPAAVVRVENAADVQAVMKWANRFGVNLRARSGGHSYAGYSTTDSGVVVDLSKLQQVKPTDNGKRARVGAGVELIRMYEKLAGKGLTVPGGSCPTVGISGLALGGGMGFASRKFGLTCDAIKAVTIVTPDGKLRRVDAKSNPDLLWACQGGGGGNFGIVTDFTFKTRKVDHGSYYFASWPWSQADAALEAWQRLTGEAADDLCTFFSLLTGSGAPKVHSEGQFFGSEADLRAALKPLRDVDGIELEIGSASYGDLMLRWAGCADESFQSCEKPNRDTFYAASAYVEKALGSGGRRDMLAAIEDRQSEGGSGAILLDGYGGKINKVDAEATAFVHRNDLYCIQYYSRPEDKGDKRAASSWVKSARSRMNRHTAGRAYQNYIDPSLRDWEKAYYGRNLDRLIEIKTTYDPENRLNFRQGIPPTA
jgi:FAD/FMN-containing dehydrogenase